MPTVPGCASVNVLLNIPHDKSSHLMSPCCGPGRHLTNSISTVHDNSGRSVSSAHVIDDAMEAQLIN